VFISGLSTTRTNFSNDSTLDENKDEEDGDITVVDNLAVTDGSSTSSTSSMRTPIMARTPSNKASTNMTVAIRTRPPVESSEKVVDIDQDQIIVALDKTFRFDQIFDENCSQSNLFDRLVAPIVGSFLEGFNATIFAYGQTGTGKTFTMGTNTRVNGITNSDRGIIPRVLETIFHSNSFFSVKISFLEILKEQVYDLLNPSKVRVPITVREDTNTHMFVVPNLTEKVVGNVEEAIALLSQGTKVRSTEATNMNDSSSRSHAVFSVILATHDNQDRTITRKFSLVDLAGSESAGKTNASGVRLAEGSSINKGLLSLGNVVGEICKRKPHVSYRDSVLTKVLKESLSGKCLVSMIACVSMDETNTNETVNTLRFANKAKELQTRPVAAHLLASCSSANRKRKLAGTIPKTPAHWKATGCNNTIGTATPSKVAKVQGSHRKLNLTIGTPGRGEKSKGAMFATPHNKSLVTPRNTSLKPNQLRNAVTSTVAKTRQEDIYEGDISGVSMIEPPEDETTDPKESETFTLQGRTMMSSADISGVLSGVLSPLMRKVTASMTESFAIQMNKEMTKFREEMSKQNAPKDSEKEKPESFKKTRMTSSPVRGRKTIHDEVDMAEDESLEREHQPTILVMSDEKEINDDDDIISGMLSPLPFCDVTNTTRKQASSASPELSQTRPLGLPSNLSSRDTRPPLAPLSSNLSSRDTRPPLAPLPSSLSSLPVYDSPPSTAPAPHLQMALAAPASPTVEEMERTLGIVNSPTDEGNFLFCAAPRPSVVPGAARAASKVRRSSRRTTMLHHELNDTLREIRSSTINRRQSVRLAERPVREATRDKYYGSPEKDEGGHNLMQGEFRHPLEVKENWNVDPNKQRKHNENILNLLNSANMKVLQALPAIGPKASLVIASERDLHDGFASIGDLANLPGLGKNFFAKFCLRNQIKLDEIGH